MEKVKAKLCHIVLIGILVLCIVFMGGLTYRYWSIETNLGMQQADTQRKHAGEMENIKLDSRTDTTNQIYLSNTVDVEISPQNEQAIQRGKKVEILKAEELLEQLESETSQEEYQMLEAFQTYYLSVVKSTKPTLYPQVQLFQNQEDTWCMLLRGGPGKYGNQDVTLVQYLKGQVQAQWLGLDGAIQVGKDHLSMAIQCSEYERLVYALYDLSLDIPRVILLGDGELNPMEEAVPKNYTYKVKQNVAPQEVKQYVFESTDYRMGEEFLSWYEAECQQLHIELTDNSENSFYWSDSVEEAYQHWIMEGMR